jgi:hypothetical protein
LLKNALVPVPSAQPTVLASPAKVVVTPVAETFLIELGRVFKPCE